MRRTLEASGRAHAILLLLGLLAASGCQGGDAGEPGVGGGGAGPAPVLRPAGALCDADQLCDSGRCLGFLCVEPCAGCAAGKSCEPVGDDPALGLCGNPAGTPDLTLGPIATDAEGRSVELTFELPEDVVAFTLLAIDDDGLRVAVRSLVAPDGTVLVNLDDAEPELCPVKPYPGASGLLVPNGDDPRAAPQPGEYRVVLGSYDPANFDALVPVAGEVERLLVFFVRAGAEGGSFDLVLHFAPATGLTAATAAGDPFVLELLEQARALLEGLAHVRLSEVGYADLEPAHDVVEDGPEARVMCSTLSGPGPAVDVFLVSDLSFTSGFAGGIPGPPGVPGTMASGIVLELLGSGRDTGILLAHELGHYLGLLHTTGLDGVPDPLGDTPECASGTEVSSCPDHGNLMFPIFPLDPGLDLTPAQVRVLRHSPLLREQKRPVACPGPGGCVDVTFAGFATGDTSRLGSVTEGSCGGAGAPEAGHLVRLLDPRSSLELVATGLDFAPVVHVRRATGEEGAELACEAAEVGSELGLFLERPGAGAYFVFVDGRDGASGSYTLEATELF